jgi:hypothetical protein
MMNSTITNSTTSITSWDMDYAAVVPRLTGSLSAVSSTLIIYVIMRSQTRLSSIYHRIMFGMSLADICGSIAMALTTLPMPSYMPKEEIFGYSSRWSRSTRLGNTHTCNAQGFFVFFGLGCVFNYNSMLCVYYACAIAFTMREKTIKKYVEPIIHSIPFLAGLAFSVPPLLHDMYNPGVSDYAVAAWCGPVSYPYKCDTVYMDATCIRGNPKISKVIRIIIVVLIFHVCCVIFFSLGMVIWKVIQTDRIIEQISKLYDNRGLRDMSKVLLEKHRNTKAVVVQASLYITAFLLGAIPPLSVGFIDTIRTGQIETANLLEKITLVFLPLQGFFNFIIFISFKVYNYRRVRHDVSICQVVVLLFCASTHEPCFISRISVVNNEYDSTNAVEDEDEVRRQHEQVHYDVEITDEMNNEQVHRCLGFIQSDHEIDPIIDPEASNSKEDPVCSSSGIFLGNFPRRSECDDDDDSQRFAEDFSINISQQGDDLILRNLSADEEYMKEESQVPKKTYYNLK